MKSLDVIPVTERAIDEFLGVPGPEEQFIHSPGLLWATSAACPFWLAVETVPGTPPSRQLLILRHTRIPRWNSKWQGRQSDVLGSGTATDQSGTWARWIGNWHSRRLPTMRPSSAARYAPSRQRTARSRAHHSLSLSAKMEMKICKFSQCILKGDLEYHQVTDVCRLSEENPFTLSHWTWAPLLHAHPNHYNL